MVGKLSDDRFMPAADIGKQTDQDRYHLKAVV